LASRVAVREVKYLAIRVGRGVRRAARAAVAGLQAERPRRPRVDDHLGQLALHQLVAGGRPN
jgi:hypothetical protein